MRTSVPVPDGTHSGSVSVSGCWKARTRTSHHGQRAQRIVCVVGEGREEWWGGREDEGKGETNLSQCGIK